MYTPYQIDRVARRIFIATCAIQSSYGLWCGTIPGGAKYALGSWKRAPQVVRKYYRRWATQALRIA